MPMFNLNIGECIYCGTTDPPLTREHVMPRGLGGNWSPSGYTDALVLQNASCVRCQRITQRIEHDCLRSMLDSARARLGLKRNDRATGLTESIFDLADGTKELRQVSNDEVLGTVCIPSFYQAGALGDGLSQMP